MRECVSGHFPAGDSLPLAGNRVPPTHARDGAQRTQGPDADDASIGNRRSGSYLSSAQSRKPGQPSHCECGLGHHLRHYP